MERPKKSLGQYWLKDEKALASICKAGDISPADTILEIGPGLGHLTRQLLAQAGQVIAVELDDNLADELRRNIANPKLTVISEDILKFDFGRLPASYKVVANIPYYLTSNLVRQLAESANPPVLAVLLVQKEVAERIAAPAGRMSLLSVSAQYYFDAKLGPTVPAELFEPPPKVDSRVVILKYRQNPLFDEVDEKTFFRLVKAGFAGRRKKLRGSLAAGLNLSKEQADKLLDSADINPDLRAQNLALGDWHKLYLAYKNS